VIEGDWVRGTTQWYVLVYHDVMPGTLVRIQSPQGRQIAYRVLTKPFAEGRRRSGWLWHSRAAEPSEVPQ